MNNETRSKSSERGVALILSLIAILVLGVLAATIMFTSQTQTWTALNYRLTTQSRYAAEAGAQATMNWLANPNKYTAPTSFSSFTTTTNPVQSSGKAVVLSTISGVTNYPDSTVVSAFNTAFPSSGNSVPGMANATYSTSATLLRMTPSSGVSWLGTGGGGVVQTWQITSQGSINGIRTATVQVVATYERAPEPIFSYAVEATATGCNAIYFGGSDGTDSYNSNNGPYNSSTNHQASGGNIAANGNITLASGTTIDGTISDVNTTVSTSACASGLPGVTNSTGKAIVANSITKMTPAAPWNCGAANPCYPSGYPDATRSTTVQDVSTTCASIPGCTKGTSITLTDNGKSGTSAAVYTLTPGTYDNLQIDNADVVHLTAGTYTVNSLDFAKDGQIVVDSGPVVFNIAGQGCTSKCGNNPSDTAVNAGGLSGWNLCSGGVTGNPGQYPTGTSQDASCGSTKSPISGIPANFQFVYAGSAEIQTTGAPEVGVIYAPNATVLETGAAVGYYGSVVCGTFSEQSKAPFHYDNSLATSAIQAGPFRPVGGFSWSKF